MKKTVLSFLALALTITATAKDTNDQQNQPYSNKAVELVAMKPFLSNKRVQEIKTARWDYVPGLVALSVLRTWEQYPDKREYYNSIKAYADNCLQGGDSIHVEPDNIDDIAVAKIFAILYKEELRLNNTKDAERYKRCAERFRTQLKYNHARIPQGYPGEGGFFHKGVYKNQMWLDGLFMGAAFWGEYESVFADKNDQEYQDDWSDIANQFITIHKYTYDKSKGLNYHAWSADPTDPSSFWANQQEPFLGASPEFWGRGMGWYFAALVDVLEVMPKKHPHYATLVKITNQVAEGLARYQDPKSGCWFQLIQYDATLTADGKGDKASNGKIYNVGTAPNYIESSATALFNYGYYKGIRIGVLSKRRYINLADRAYKGMIENFIEEDQHSMFITRSCASAGLGPAKDLSRTGTINYYLCGKDIHITQNEGKAIGAFILASVEREKLKRK